MSGFSFDMLDRHIISGRGEEISVQTSERSFSYIELLEHTAALAGGLRRLGVNRENSLDLRLDASWERLSFALAMVRLELAPYAGARAFVSAHPVRMSIDNEELNLATLIKIGRVDPEPAPGVSDPDLFDAFEAHDREWFSRLQRGQYISFL